MRKPTPKTSLGRQAGLLLALALVLATFGCSAPAPTPSPTTNPGPRPEGTGSLAFGFHTQLWMSGDKTERDLQLVKDAGFGWIKQRFEWRYMEQKAKGQISFERADQIVQAANKAGLKIIARVDNQPEWATAKRYGAATAPPDKPQDYADFVGAMAARYKAGSPYGRIHAYEIWNEPNLSREWGNRAPSAAEYVALLKAAYEAIKKADPEAIVITAGLSPTTAPPPVAVPDVDYLKQMYAAGAKGYFDVLGVHGAGFKAPPEISPDDVARDPRYNHGEGAKGRVYCFRHVEDLRAVMVENGDAAKKVAVLEFGWTTDNRPGSPYGWHAVSPEEQANYLVGAFKYAKENWSSWIGPMVVIYLADPTMTKDQEQYYWAVTNPDGTPRPAYNALKAMPK